MPDTGGRALDFPRAGPNEPENGDLGFGKLLDVARRRIWVFLIVAGLVMGAVLLDLATAQRLYTAQALVQIDVRQVTPLGAELGEVVSTLPPDSAVIDTETEVLRSRALAGRVADELSLVSAPEFNPNARRRSETRNALRDRERTIDALLQRIVVQRVGLTHIIAVNATAADPSLAARIADAFAQGYLAQQMETKYDVIAQTNEWLAHRLDGLRREVEDKESAAERHRAAQGLLTAEGASLNEQSIAQLNAELVAARAALAEREARLGAVRSGLNQRGGAEATGEALNSPVVADLRRQQAEVARRRGELATRYGPMHPEMRKIDREASDLEARIADEIRRVAENLAAEVAIAQRRVASIEDSLGGARTQLATDNVQNVRQRELDRDAEASRKLYEGFLARSRQIAEQGDLERADARIVSRATPPTEPSSPDVGMTLALGLLLSLALGVGAVAGAEAFERSLRNGEDVQSRLGAAYLGSIPFLRRADRRVDGDLVTPESYVLRRPVSAFGEALRSLRASLVHAGRERGAKTVAVTSAVPEEGKTTTAVGLARIAALAGSRVCLVDCDLRRRSATHAVGLQCEVGLTEVLGGGVSLDEALSQDPDSSVMVLPLAQAEFTPRDLLGGESMRTLLATLKERFDLVILDTAPVLPLSDTRVLSPFVDTVLVVARWGRTPVATVAEAMEHLRAHGARIAGVALEGADSGLFSRLIYDPGDQHQELYKTYYLR